MTQIRAASRSTRSFFVLFLLLSGDVCLNPGPRNWKYPCSVCHKPVTKNQDGPQCDQCDVWTHLKCLPDAIHITKDQYVTLSHTDTYWYCYGCQLPILSDSYFSSRSNDDDDNEFERFHTKGLHFLHINTRSLLPKLDELRHIAIKSKASVIGITETWLDDSLPDSEVEIPGYSLQRQDRNRNGGGVCVYINSNIS